MNKSESLINNLLSEVEALSDRITNIHQSFLNTSNLGLRERLFYENINISQRLDEILSICLLYTSPSPRDRTRSRMPSSA